jgi:hypothetical protein
MRHPLLSARMTTALLHARAERNFFKFKCSLHVRTVHNSHHRAHASIVINCCASVLQCADVCHMLLQVTAHVSDAVSKGAKVLVGGQVPELPEPLSHGHFYAPTVLAEATIDM